MYLLLLLFIYKHTYSILVQIRWYTIDRPDIGYIEYIVWFDYRSVNNVTFLYEEVKEVPVHKKTYNFDIEHLVYQEFGYAEEDTFWRLIFFNIFIFSFFFFKYYIKSIKNRTK